MTTMKNTLLRALMRVKDEFELTVAGVSMQPILSPGERLRVRPAPTYAVGDILVFFYKNDTLLVHRLLRIEGERFFCKGDNAFRIEDIPRKAIVGRVVLSSDPHNEPAFLAASLAIGRLFRANDYDLSKTMASPAYAAYAETYLGEKRI